MNLPSKPFSYQAVVFDMDGVIVDSEPHHQSSFHALFSELVGEHGMDFEDFVGRCDAELWESFEERHRTGLDLESLAVRREIRLLEILQEADAIFPGLPELVRCLSTRTPLGLASGSRHRVIEGVLHLARLREHFNALSSVEDVERGKPDPAVYLHALRQLGVSPQDAVAIEDTPSGISAARAAGMKVIAVTHTFPADRLGHADVIVASHGEVADWLGVSADWTASMKASTSAS